MIFSLIMSCILCKVLALSPRLPDKVAALTRHILMQSLLAPGHSSPCCLGTGIWLLLCGRGHLTP